MNPDGPIRQFDIDTDLSSTAELLRVSAVCILMLSHARRVWNDRTSHRISASDSFFTHYWAARRAAEGHRKQGLFHYITEVPAIRLDTAEFSVVGLNVAQDARVDGWDDARATRYDWVAAGQRFLSGHIGLRTAWRPNESAVALYLPVGTPLLPLGAELRTWRSEVFMGELDWGTTDNRYDGTIAREFEAHFSTASDETSLARCRRELIRAAPGYYGEQAQFEADNAI